jgi:hypothetical protein
VRADGLLGNTVRPEDVMSSNINLVFLLTDVSAYIESTGRRVYQHIRFILRLEEVCFARVLQQTITQLAFTLAYFCSETLFAFLSQGDKHGATCQGLPSASQLAADSLSRGVYSIWGPLPTWETMLSSCLQPELLPGPHQPPVL